MEDNGVKVREAKEESQVKKSAEQIRDKKQDIKFDVRDYPINYLVSQYEKQEGLSNWFILCYKVL